MFDAVLFIVSLVIVSPCRACRIPAAKLLKNSAWQADLISINCIKSGQLNINFIIEMFAVYVCLMDSSFRVHTGPKVVENQPNGCCIFDLCSCFGLYARYHCLLSGSVRHGSTTWSSNTIKLHLLKIFGKSYQ